MLCDRLLYTLVESRKWGKTAYGGDTYANDNGEQNGKAGAPMGREVL